MKPATPNLDKMLAVKDISQEQGLFIDWLKATHGLTLCMYTHYRDEDEEDEEHECIRACGWIPTGGGEGALNKFLAEYHDIDYAAMEAERDAILAWIRAGGILE